MYLRGSDFEVGVHSLLFQPEFYLFDFDPRAGLTRFLVMREEILEQAPFIDIRVERMAQASFRVSTDELMSLEGQHAIERPPVNYIFHHSFVCSTLLARCLNQIDAFFSLKEPWILRRLADTKRAAPLAEADWREKFRQYNALLSKEFSAGRSTLIKATNVANNLVVDVVRLMPASRILYLWSDLRSFLGDYFARHEDRSTLVDAAFREEIAFADFPQAYLHALMRPVDEQRGLVTRIRY